MACIQWLKRVRWDIFALYRPLATPQMKPIRIFRTASLGSSINRDNQPLKYTAQVDVPDRPREHVGTG